MRRLVLAAVAVAALLLVPPGLGSHTMGHRYLVYGRLLDASGMPVQNAEVEIRIENRVGVPLAGIRTTTDCLGDFENWEGSPGSVPPGGGQVEQNQHDGIRYIAFHFHDPELTDQNRVRVFAEGENWTEAFVSRDRQTPVLHQLAAAAPMRCPSYDEFNSTFQVHVSILSDAEKQTGETAPKPRDVGVRFPNGNNVDATTDYNGAVAARGENQTLAVGETFTVTVEDVGERTFEVDAEAIQFRRANLVFEPSGNVGTSLDDFRYVGIFLLVAAFAVALYFAGGRLKRRREESRLRQATTRRRFRREGGGEPPP